MGEQDAGGEAFPRCRACGRGELVPLSDFGPQGGEVRYKAWVCTNPACGFAVKIHGGEISRGAPVLDGTAKGPDRTRPPASPRTPLPRAAPPRPPARPK
jgi:hypothetical protein